MKISHIIYTIDLITGKMHFKNRLYFTAFILAAIWSLLIYDHLYEGVPSHHILQREDLPAFSNWWGGLLLPLITWFLLWRIQKRAKNSPEDSNALSKVFYAFTAALVFGILLSVFFTFNYEEMPVYMLGALFIGALFFPIYIPECFLGFIIGMTFTFGGVLPIIIGSILSLVGVFLYWVVRPAIRFAFTKIGLMT